MRRPNMQISARAARALAAIALAAAAGWAMATDARGSARITAEADEPGTIPAARPGLPKMQKGAEGPVRSDDERAHKADPSVRDTNPLTKNGLWETLPGNVIARPLSER